MHPFRALVFAALLGTAAHGHAAPALNPPLPPSPEVLAATDADTAWKLVDRLSDRTYLERALGDLKGAERTAVVMKLYVDTIRDGAAFLQAYPNDPRRWDAILKMAQISDGLANADGTLKSTFQPSDKLPWDTAAWAAWLPQIQALKAQIATALDATPGVRLAVELEQPGGLLAAGQDLRVAQMKKEPVNFTPFRTELLRLADKYPDVPMIGNYVASYLMVRADHVTDEAQLAELNTLAAHTNPHVRAAAQTEIDKRAKLAKPLDITFTAVDGRAVDLAQLRGKVVLIDFWATWCGPCVAELPNIKKVYAAYHDKGFEIVGISLENARLATNDTPEQTAAKLEKAKKVLTDFTTKESMPWPQYFDGKFWKNDISTRYAINAIPAMFLLDKEGRVVSTNARGEKLETEVKRLLGL